MEATTRAIRKFVIDNFLFGEDGDHLADNDSFMGRGIVDSTGILELVGFIQDAFAIVIEDHELIPQNLDSIASVARFVHTKKVSGLTAAP
ncbi:MAG TPA: acyl carrier protein [Acidobacteriota bacterium]|nr:acyl carrier protein [Acidobacteriota bacterium]